MSLIQFVLRSIWHYRKSNLSVVLGVALSTAILLGALIIGDSVRFSLEEVARQRLGKVSLIISANERLFGQHLATDLSGKTGIETSAMLRSNGICVLDGGKSQFNQLAIWGVDQNFSLFAGNPGSVQLKENEAAINENLAKLAGLSIGDEILLRINKLNTFPSNTPFVSANETSVSFRVTIKQILLPEALGNFSMQNNQSSPRNLFLDLKWMNEQMKLQSKANVLLVSEGINEQELIRSLQRVWKMEDLNLNIRENQTLNYTEIISDRVFIDPAVEQFCVKNLPLAHPVFTYFVNEFSFRGFNAPYSFVSTNDTLSGQQMMVSQWLSEDLNVKVKDTIKVDYFEVGPLRKLVRKETGFVTKRIYLPEGRLADPDLMPVIPGLSDAGNCRDWKTGVPVDLKKIRPKDESYWKRFKGTPKAFISTQTAQRLWGNRFGQSTAIRVEGLQGNGLEQAILGGLLPYQVGFAVNNARAEGMQAAGSGVDFGQLFIGLSFFVLAAALLLAYLFFKLYLAYRRNDIETLAALGFSAKKTRILLITESMLLIITGILIGIPCGILYNYLILKAINTIWFDIVRTSIAQIYLNPVTLLLGALVVAAVSLAAIYNILNHFLKSKKTNFQTNSHTGRGKRGNASLVAGVLLTLIAVALLLRGTIAGNEINPDLFYISGMGMLPGLLLMLDSFLRRIAASESQLTLSFSSFILKRLAGERKRTLLAVAFLSIGIFMVISTGLYRKDASLHVSLPSSGSGGYDFYIETTLPVLSDLNNRQGKMDLGLPSSAQIVPFHVQSGDDASCLNLNRISRPRIIACDPARFDQRSAFTFSTHTDELDLKHPWSSLNKKLADDVVPAFADQTVIQWGLGKKTGDTLIYKDETGAPLKLKLIGGLENSVFQGNVLIAEDFFVKAFPSVSGASLFLVQADTGSVDRQEFREGWRPYGPEIVSTAERLQNFNVIENTYLNIFLMLGALGLLIGTAGLGILIFRITLEQIPEYALLQSVGIRKVRIFRLLLSEKVFITLSAVLIGSLSATFSALPVIISPSHSNLWLWLPAIAVAVVLSGTISTIIAVRLALKNNLVKSLSGE